jgi:hypothetical protein
MNASEIPSQMEEKPGSTELFYAGAIDRIKRAVLILGLLLSPIGGFLYGIKPAAGFLLGAALSYLNFHLLARAVHGLAGRIVNSGSGEKGETIVARFLVRYLVIGMVVYVTFVSSFAAFKGLLIGLCLPVAGMMAEAAYEFYMAARRGF